jgi:hypothetical protein
MTLHLGIAKRRSPQLADTLGSACMSPRYRSARARAWRNTLVVALNTGIERRLFGLREGDNFWPAAPVNGCRYRFLAGGIPAIAVVNAIGFGELSIHCALWPVPLAETVTPTAFADWWAGECVASGWLERRTGAHLQTFRRLRIKCRASRLAHVAGLNLEPIGYRDCGPFFM